MSIHVKDFDQKIGLEKSTPLLNKEHLGRTRREAQLHEDSFH